MRQNLIRIRERLKKGTRLLLMLKADGYNHGALEIARAADCLSDWYGVANAEEGVQLRRNCIIKPILVTVFSEIDSALIVQYGLTPIIYNLEQAERLSRESILQGKNTRVHIKLDTGMNRLGIKNLKEYENLVNAIKCLPNISLEGVCTHLFGADEFSLEKQKALFDRFTVNNKNLIRHTASSIAMHLDESYQYDMVRVGISAYGYSDYLSNIQPVMSVHSTILTIKRVYKGETVGYNGTHRADRDTNIAVIRGGYYDGIHRNFKGVKVIIKNKLYPIIAVCMDITIVDIGNDEISFSDCVIIIGESSKKRNTAEEVAKELRTIPYEVLTGFKGRIERIYYD